MALCLTCATDVPRGRTSCPLCGSPSLPEESRRIGLPAAGPAWERRPPARKGPTAASLLGGFAVVLVGSFLFTFVRTGPALLAYALVGAVALWLVHRSARR